MLVVLVTLCGLCLAVSLVALLYADFWGVVLFAALAVGCWEAASLVEEDIA